MNSKTVLIVGCLVFGTILGDKTAIADKVLPKLYEEIGCKEINGSNSDIGVTRFECPEVTTYAIDKCYLKGRTFNVGDDIPEDIVPECRAACKCRKNENEAASIVCANVECPEHFGGRDWTCISQYKDVSACCRIGEICDQARIGQMNSCEIDGKSYHVGEQFYPEDDSCYKCFCAENFNNNTSYADNPNCVKINCGIELKLSEIKAGCVPVYYKTPTCCPIEYKCPSKDDSIATTAATHPSATCKFGDLSLKLGEKLKSDDKCLKCECSTPPIVTCIKTNDC